MTSTPFLRCLFRRIARCASVSVLLSSTLSAAEADLILHHGKVVTVDSAFSIRQAVAVKDGRILAVGSDRAVLASKGPKTELVDLGGKMVLPGLMDSHAHPADACLTEFDHPIPAMERIQDVLEYIQARARELKEGEWIEVRQVFLTRLREQRYPTRAELDRVEQNYWVRQTATGKIFSFGVFLTLVVAAVVVYQVLSGDIRDHLSEYATLKAIGYHNRYLTGVVFQEALLLALLGFVPGVFLGLGFYQLLGDWTGLPLQLTLFRGAFVLVLTVLMCFVSGLAAIRKVQTADPAEVFR